MTTTATIFLVVVLLAAASVSAALAYRFRAVRGHSTPLLLSHRSGRRAGVWRYGAMRYTGDEAMFYRLVSLRPGADLRIVRRTITPGERRPPSGRELDLAEDGEVVVPVTGATPAGEPVDVELCLVPDALTALLSWVEACSTDDVRHIHHRPRRP